MKNKRKQRKRFSHFTQHDRDRMEILLRQGCLQKDIADVLKVDPGTISRERKRQRKNGVYDADTAQRKAQAKRCRSKYQGMKVESNLVLREYVIRELKNKRSPDEIAGRMKREMLPFACTKDAIYAWLYSAWGQAYCAYLCSKRYRRRKQKNRPKREMIPNAIPIHERPAQGIHAQGDTFVSPRKANTASSGAVVCIEETKLLVGTKIPNLRPATMAHAVPEAVAGLRMDTLTLDRGIENKHHKKFGIPTYFCDPHSPWQKPLVEQSIGLLRRWFIPKGTDLRTVSEGQLQEYFAVLNSKWRKSLGYQSAIEASLERGIMKQPPPLHARAVPEVAFHPRI
jgi:transposase, IS30 family